MSDTRNRTLVIPPDLLAEIRRQAKRQDRPISWIVQRAWKIAKEKLRKYPAPPDAAREP